MSTIFDKPEWTYRTPAEHVGADNPALIDVDITATGGKTRTVRVVAPSELYKFVQEVMHLPTIHGLVHYLDQEGERWYMGLANGDVDYEMWYYTKSNLPYWAK